MFRLSYRFAAAALWLLAPLAADADTARGSHFVRVPAEEAARLAGIPAERSLDYGSFRWLVLTESGLRDLEARGVRFEEVAEAGQVRVGAHRFDPLAEGEPALPAASRASSAGEQLRLVHLIGPTRTEWIGQLAAAGLRVLQYYPHHTYLVWAGESQIEAAETLDFVRWQGLLHPAYKISEQLLAKSGRIENVDVSFFNAGDPEPTLRALETLGATVLQSHAAQPDGAFWDAIVQVGAELLAEIAALPEVVWLGYESPRPTLDDEMSSQIVAGNYTAGVPFIGYNTWLSSVGLDGSGVTWAIVDTGVDYDHPDLGPHIVGGSSFAGACDPPGQPGSDCSGGGHGTHVAGIVGGDASGLFADANGFLYGLGVAPAYGIYAMNSLSGSAWPPAGGWQEHTKRALLGGAIGSNNSWTTGEGTAHGYQASERTHDFMVRDGNFDTPAVAEPFTLVFSAGNSGPGASTLTAPKEAKNMISVANSQNFRAGSIDVITNSSSRGPAVDGRILPTVAAPGTQIASSRNDLGGLCATAIAGTNNLYAFCTGTSMAAPHVSGAAVLLTEWWRQEFPAAGDPSPAMLKALLVNGTVDMGTADIPNNNEGWGRIHLPSMITPTVSRALWDQNELLSDTGQQFQVTLGVPDATKPLKVSLAWTDAPGALGANPALVNNLDLVVENNGNTYLGNRFVSGWSATGGTADIRSNVENVFVQSPGGSATITVAATLIAGDGVPLNGDPTDQDFALVCWNCALQADFTLGAGPASQSICAGANAVYTVDVGSVLGFSNPVTLGASGHPAGTTATFVPNPVTPGNSSTLTIGNTAGASAGSYSIEIQGSSTTGVKTRDVGLEVFTGNPAAATLLTPADGALDVPRRPTLSWSAAAQAASYLVEVAIDAGFGSIVRSTTVPGTSWEVTPALDGDTTYFWRVTGGNACGQTVSAAFEFHTANPTVLLVDDDDDTPNVQDRYQTTLNSLAVYDVWDVVVEGGEPTLDDLRPYRSVVWFSGDRFTGSTSPSAGPQAAAQDALALYLQNGRCLFLSSQDYGWDMLGSGTQAANAFMQQYLGFSQVASDSGDYTRVDGENVYSPYQDLTLTYAGLFSDFSDTLTLGSGQTAFRGDLPAGNTNLGAVSKLGPTYFTTFLAFPLEAMSEANRGLVLQRFFDTCQAEVPMFADSFESGDSCAWSSGAAAACP